MPNRPKSTSGNASRRDRHAGDVGDRDSLVNHRDAGGCTSGDDRRDWTRGCREDGAVMNLRGRESRGIVQVSRVQCGSRIVRERRRAEDGAGGDGGIADMGGTDAEGAVVRERRGAEHGQGDGGSIHSAGGGREDRAVVVGGGGGEQECGAVVHARRHRGHRLTSRSSGVGMSTSLSRGDPWNSGLVELSGRNAGDRPVRDGSLGMSGSGGSRWDSDVRGERRAVLDERRSHDRHRRRPGVSRRAVGLSVRDGNGLVGVVDGSRQTRIEQRSESRGVRRGQGGGRDAGDGKRRGEHLRTQQLNASNTINGCWVGRRQERQRCSSSGEEEHGDFLRAGG